MYKREQLVVHVVIRHCVVHRVPTSIRFRTLGASAARVYEHRYRISGRDAKQAARRVLRKLSASESHCPRFPA